jgi:integrase
MSGQGSEFLTKLALVNNALDRVTVRAKNGRLYARATLPPKPGDGSRPKQYELSLKCRATLSDLRIAKAKAQEIESQLQRDRFDWIPYLKEIHKPAETCGEWIDRLTKDHWQVVPQTPTKLNSWQKDYGDKLCKLPPEKPLTSELLRRVIVERSQPGTRNRKGYCLAYRKLARFAGIEHEVDWKILAAGYKPKPCDSTKLPTDEEIIEIWKSLESPGWRWIFGMMACYGVRNHEVFRIVPESIQVAPGVLRITDDSKSQRRSVYPVPSAWWELFDLSKIALPNIKQEGRNNNDLGEKISQKFSSLKIPFSPYVLRDAYAVRCSVLRVPIEYAAQWMGHSVEVHEKHYLDAIGKVHHEAIFQQMQEMEQKIK